MTRFLKLTFLLLLLPALSSGGPNKNKSYFEDRAIGMIYSRERAGRVELDGEIGLDSEPGRGSTFWIRLPLNEKID